jgi:hypothetical protein
VGTSAVRSAPCDGSWQAVLVVTVAVVQLWGGGGSTFVRQLVTNSNSLDVHHFMSTWRFFVMH